RRLDCTSSNYAILQIIEQDSQGENFPDFIASNGVKIRSILYPQYSSSDQTLYVRGKETRRDNSLFLVPLADLSKVIEAVKEYNRNCASASATDSLIVEEIF
ncbi:MAG: hypothetical protein D6746_11440, partial [Bacteroidetes bacterium]